MSVQVLETSWELLVTELGRARDMDGLIAAHEKYLDRIFEKVQCFGCCSRHLLAPVCAFVTNSRGSW